MNSGRKFVDEIRFEDPSWRWDKYVLIEETFSMLSGMAKRPSVLLVDTLGQVSARDLRGAISQFTAAGGSPLRLRLRTTRLGGSVATLDVTVTKSGVVVARVQVASRSEVKVRGLLAAVRERLDRGSGAQMTVLPAPATAVRRVGRTANTIVKNPWFVAATAAFGAGLVLCAFHLSG